MSPPPQARAPNPYALAFLAVSSFASFVYVVRFRDSDPRNETREKRIHHPNPLIPPRHQNPQ
jgi:hypothetical protein